MSCSDNWKRVAPWAWGHPWLITACSEIWINLSRVTGEWFSIIGEKSCFARVSLTDWNYLLCDCASRDSELDRCYRKSVVSEDCDRNPILFPVKQFGWWKSSVALLLRCVVDDDEMRCWAVPSAISRPPIRLSRLSFFIHSQSKNSLKCRWMTKD